MVFMAKKGFASAARSGTQARVRSRARRIARIMFGFVGIVLGVWSGRIDRHPEQPSTRA
jgi:hypothetical protein